MVGEYEPIFDELAQHVGRYARTKRCRGGRPRRPIRENFERQSDRMAGGDVRGFSGLSQAAQIRGCREPRGKKFGVGFSKFGFRFAQGFSERAFFGKRFKVVEETGPVYEIPKIPRHSSVDEFFRTEFEKLLSVELMGKLPLGL